MPQTFPCKATLFHSILQTHNWCLTFRKNQDLVKKKTRAFSYKYEQLYGPKQQGLTTSSVDKQKNTHT